MKGIYKITFNNNKSYIGQSCNLDRRFSEYKNTCKNQVALYNAFNKYRQYDIIILESSLDFT